MEKKLDLLLSELQKLNERVGSIEVNQHELSKDMNSMRVSQHELSKNMDGLRGSQHELSKNVDGLRGSQHELSKNVDGLRGSQHELSKEVRNISTELKEFRSETKTSLQIIQAGQEGTRAEMTQRFKETKKSLERLESDVEFTYQKAALQDLKIHRIENISNEQKQ